MTDQAGSAQVRRSEVLAASHGLLGVLLGVLVFAGLPARWAPVDVPAVCLMLLSGVGAVGLWLRRPWGVTAARLASGAYLLAGAIVITMLAMSVSYLAALYGPVGSGGALLMAGFAALLLPYMIFLPAWQLLAARR